MDRCCRGRCGRELAPAKAVYVDPGQGRHSGRNLCHACRKWAIREGILADFERTYRPMDELIEEWQRLARWEGLGRTAAAERLGIPRNSLDQAILRWSKRQEAVT